MVVGLAEELDATRLGQLLKAGQHLGSVLFELFEDHAGDAVGDLEPALMLTDQIQHQLVGGQIAFARHLAADLGVLVLVEVVGVGVEDGIVSEPVGLVHLKVETD